MVIHGLMVVSYLFTEPVGPWGDPLVDASMQTRLDSIDVNVMYIFRLHLGDVKLIPTNNIYLSQNLINNIDHIDH